MIINWGDAPFKAYIRVTYLQGTCTISLGNKSYTHSGGGTHTFEVNKKGTWTVSAVLGENVVRKEVEVTTRGGVTNVELHFPTLTIYSRGNEYLPLTLKNTIGSSVSVVKGTSNIVLNYAGGDACCVLNTPVNLTDYSTLKVTYLSKNVYEKLGGIAVSAAAAPTWRYDSAYTTANRWDHATSSGEKTATYDVSSLSGIYYVGVFISAYSAPASPAETIYRIELV